MVIAKLYGNYLYHAVLGNTTSEMKWTANAIRCILCTSSYSPNQDTHEFYSQITASNELTTFNGYTVGGANVTSQTATYSTNNVITLDCSDAVWSNSTITARYAVLYDLSSGAASTAQVLIGYVDFEADQSSSSGTFTVQWSSAGVVAITVA